MKEKESNRTVSHIVGLVLGIISILTTFFWYISLPSGIIAIVLGTKSYKNEGKKLGLAGLITGIIGIALCLLIYISLMILIYLQNNVF